jgi:hypothetical protein
MRLMLRHLNGGEHQICGARQRHLYSSGTLGQKSA